jgi:4-amino-4-deoxy-L-arabinose transferase-like glycosyltransferase
MMPKSDISILDWLKEKSRNLVNLLRRQDRSPSQEPAAQPPATGPVGMPSPVAGFSTSDARPASGNEQPESLLGESIQHIHVEPALPGSPHPEDRYAARVNISADIPPGTTLTITLRADRDGQVSVEKSPEQTISSLKENRPRPPISLPKIQLPDLSGLSTKFNTFLEKAPLLRNGLLFAAITFIAALMADDELRMAREFSEAAILPLLLGGVLFTWATWVIHRNGPGLLDNTPGAESAGGFSNQQRQNIALGLIVAAIALTLWVSRDSVSGDSSVNSAWMLIRWLFGILMVCLAAWLLQENVRGQAAPRNKWLIMGVAGIVLLAFGLRIWQLGNIPYTLGGDEGEQGVEILRVISGNLTNPFITGWYSVPTFSFFFNAPTVALFGNTSFGLRLVWVLVGTASVLVTYLLVKELKGTRLALFTAALVATYHYHIHYSRLGSNQISDTLLVGLTLFFLMRGYSRGKWLDWTLAGVVAGIGQYFYAGGRLALILGLLLVVYLWMQDRFRLTRRKLIGLGIFIIAALVAGGPMFAYAINHPNDYNARANQIGILQSGWLTNEVLQTGKSQAEILLDQFLRAALAFNAYPDRTGWYGLDAPLLDRFSGTLFILGIFSATLWSLRDRRLAPMAAWWWSAILTGGMLTDTTPSSQRLITTSIPTMFFVAWAIEHFVSALGRRLPKIAIAAAGAAVVLVLSIISINLYFNQYTPQRLFAGEHALIGTMISEHVIEDLGPNTQIYFFGAPRMYGNIGTMRYLLADVPKIDVLEPLENRFEPDPAPEKNNLLFVFLPERANELAWVQESFPGGQTAEIASPARPDKILYTTYVVTKNASP